VRYLIAPLWLLASCQAQTTYENPSLLNNEFSTATDVLSVIDICRGFAENWQAWLKTRKSAGWVLVYSNSGKKPSYESADIATQSAVLKNQGLLMNATVQTSSKGMVGKLGRCDIAVKVKDAVAMSAIKTEVFSKLPSIRPDFAGTRYISKHENISFNESKGSLDSDPRPITLYVLVGYDDTRPDASTLELLKTLKERK
jgi:hypothetical protein